MVRIRDCMYQPAMWLGCDDQDNDLGMASLYRIYVWNPNHFHNISKMSGTISCIPIHSNDCYADRSWQELLRIDVVSKLGWEEFVEAVKTATADWGGFVDVMIPLRLKPGCMGYGRDEDSAMLAWRKNGVWHSNL